MFPELQLSVNASKVMREYTKSSNNNYLCLFKISRFNCYLTLQLPWVTKTEFLLTNEYKYQLNRQFSISWSFLILTGEKSTTFTICLWGRLLTSSPLTASHTLLLWKKWIYKIYLFLVNSTFFPVFIQMQIIPRHLQYKVYFITKWNLIFQINLLN